MTAIRPHVDQAARHARFDDVGLIYDDTEGLRAHQTRAVPEAWIDQQARRGLEERVRSTP